MKSNASLFPTMKTKGKHFEVLGRFGPDRAAALVKEGPRKFDHDRRNRGNGSAPANENKGVCHEVREAFGQRYANRSNGSASNGSADDLSHLLPACQFVGA
jgi:hypothetical protein